MVCTIEIDTNLTPEQAKFVLDNLDMFISRFESETGKKITPNARQMIVETLQGIIRE